MIDGSTNTGIDFWRETKNNKPNTNYNISYWLLSIVAQNSGVIKLKINAKQVGNNLTANLASISWKNNTTQWFSGNAYVVTISLEDSNILAQGNDFTTDDISLNEIFIH